mmetsp:Transcript_66445/g.131037  ORF Transcript_66445/g.131037 Transcript_66445/m.131037 type:complete len:134 (-) Transcript_66445:215-616(-)|eukprot:CAMPEP_0172720564 /NCGR_PEP_ID=MMETSP1074-20121228/77206_1 /TAXON_ID=2916 /ORGANISM="Ceratium fusus, Strain PA161109" /LENGTH=133 /DNA_ID=CAMNT_0013546101 /DNA_START=54 /DNA_END=455 /DNA_ORIENTATION=-
MSWRCDPDSLQRNALGQAAGTRARLALAEARADVKLGSGEVTMLPPNRVALSSNQDYSLEDFRQEYGSQGHASSTRARMALAEARASQGLHDKTDMPKGHLSEESRIVHALPASRLFLPDVLPSCKDKAAEER